MRNKNIIHHHLDERHRAGALAPCFWAGPSAIMSAMDDRTKLIDYIKKHSFLTSEEEIFLLSSGKRSNVYFDLRLTTLSPEGQYLIGTLLYTKIKELGLKPSAVGGLTMGADPVASAVAFASYLKGDPMEAFIVRKEAKAHGRGRQIEGNVDPGDDVVIVDDVLTTGGSTIKAVNIAREMGLNVLAAMVILDRCEQNGRQNVEQHCPLYSLLTVDDVRND
jgi:orotate phosphoribosyltransferase